MSTAPRHTDKTLNLALQGGGSHGAFTWGVLDRLLEEKWLTIEGVSGTSAGAMNAAVLAHGYAVDGRQGARIALGAFWRKIGASASGGPFHRSFLDAMLDNWNIDRSPRVMLAQVMNRLASPYQTNPLNIDPLRQILEDSIDIDKVRASPIKVYISATNVHTGRARIFDSKDVTIDAVMASACLPFVFQAVEIDGEPYWDGGYVGNPTLWPLIYHCKTADIAVVQINPLLREGTPQSPAEIINRINEISFNATLMGEMRAIAFVDRLISENVLTRLGSRSYKPIRMHRIAAEEEMRQLGASSKMNAEISFLEHLQELGRNAASLWLVENADSIGRRSTVDIQATYL